MEVSPEPRRVCFRCMRPERVCYCSVLPKLTTRSRVVLLQHPRESRVAIGSAHMASLCLPSSELHVGVSWDDSKDLARVLSDPTRPAALLYPGEGAIDVVRHPPPGPITLVVVDGTWWQARKLVRQSRVLSSLPRYAFVPPSPSEYRIRKEPHPDYVSTIEALMHVLGAIEGEPERFRELLVPFRAMIDAQIACERAGGERRVKKPRAVKPAPRGPHLLSERRHDLVCVVGEANAWPYQDGERNAEHPDELVQWVAHRPSTGETFERFVAPRNPLAPMTPKHLRVEESALRGGGTLEDLLFAWRGFIEEDDVVCAWGYYATSLFLGSGGWLPRARVDVRHAARVYARGKVGAIEDFVVKARTGEAPPPLATGRAGARITELTEIVDLLAREG